MISKLVAWGRDRQEVIARMRRALSEYIIRGVTTNIPFHKAVMRNGAFVRGDLSTHFIQENDIVATIPAVVEADRAREERLEEIFQDDRKVVAISSAVSAYIDQEKRKAG